MKIKISESYFSKIIHRNIASHYGINEDSPLVIYFHWICLRRSAMFGRSIYLKRGRKYLPEYVDHFFKGAKMDNDEAVDYMNEFFKEETVLSLDARIVYDYQKVLYNACCPSCKEPLSWKLSHSTSDKFATVSCCGMQYSLVPEAVRVIAVPEATLQQQEADADDDFMKELSRL